MHDFLRIISETQSNKKRHIMIVVAILTAIAGTSFYLQSVSYTDEDKNEEPIFLAEQLPEENVIPDYGAIPEEGAEKSIAEICLQDHRTEGGYKKGSVIVVFQPELTSAEIDEFFVRHPEIISKTFHRDLDTVYNVEYSYTSLGVPFGKERCFARELSKEPGSEKG